MALGGLSPVFIFTFFKKVPNIPLIGSLPKIPILPIPVYLDEKVTGLQLDDYNRTISIDVMREGVTSFEKVSGDVVTLKFRAKKDNIPLTALTALFDQIISTFDKKLQEPGSPDYMLTIFYDNIFLLDCSLEQLQTTLIDGTDLREISIQLANRPKKEKAKPSEAIANTGTSTGINGN